MLNTFKTNRKWGEIAGISFSIRCFISEKQTFKDQGSTDFKVLRIQSNTFLKSIMIEMKMVQIYL